MKTKVNKNLHKQGSSQDLEAMPSKNKQTRKAEYIHSDKTEIYYYGLCPECGNIDHLYPVGRGLCGYCGEHNTAWCIPHRPDDPQGAPEFCELVEERGYKKVTPIMNSIESPENKVAMLGEIQSLSITPTPEIHLVDQEIQFRDCFGLHPLPDGCTVQVRFREHLSYEDQMKQLKLIQDQIVDLQADRPF